MRVPITILDRHIYLSQQDAKKLFGNDFILQKKKDLPQPWHYISTAKLTLKGPRWSIQDITVFWPFCKQTQVILLARDQKLLDITVSRSVPWEWISPRSSADITLIGSQGKINITHWTIIAQKHLRMTVADAEEFGLYDGQIVHIKTSNEKKHYIFDNVVVKVRDAYVFDFHIDKEEAETAGLGQGSRGEIIV